MAYLEEILPEFRKGAKIRVKGWLKGFFLQIKDGTIVDQNKQPYNLNLVDLKCAKWEIYQEPINWEYIIKNKCLCWFWDEHQPKEIQAKYLEAIGDGFLDTCGFTWDCCRPVRRDEITFYEDRKD